MVLKPIFAADLLFKMILNKFSFISILLAFSNMANAQNSSDTTSKSKSDSVSTYFSNHIITSKNNVDGNLPGSTAKIPASEIKNLIPFSANDVFRKVAGVHVVDEEGAGMRINIGIRGLDPDRSRGVLVLEDGVPVALNPYGEPEMYYSPVMDRMSGVEVIKGNGQILYGPQTIGGVVNYYTADPSLKETKKVKLTVGSGGLMSALVNYSNTINNVGINSSALHKRAEQFGYVGFMQSDVTNKIVIKVSNKTKVTFKTSLYDEQSNSTYIGLTQSMYNAGNQDFTLMAPEDHLSIRRNFISSTLNHDFSKRFKISNVIFANSITRNWQRQDFSSSKTSSNQTGVIWGDSSISNGAVFMRNQNAHRNRQFEVVGEELRTFYKYNIGKVKNELNAGARFLYERAFEQRLNGKKFDSKTGDLVEDEIRTGYAFSAHAQNQTFIGKKMVLTIGLRFEDYNYERRILRNTFTVNSITKLVDTNLVATNHISTVIPGFGFNYNIQSNTTIFAGVHKGYAPPRVKDAITATGQVYQLDAEESINSELGIRGKFKKVLQYELCAYRIDFENQIIPVSESSGGTGAGLVNGGRTLNQGIEASFKLNFNQAKESKIKQFISGSLSFVDAKFVGDRFSGTGSNAINVKGNSTPYAPKYFHNFGYNIELPSRIGLNLNANFVGEQYTDMTNSVAPSADGRNGLINAYKVFDAACYYSIPKLGMYVNFAVKNLTNERYITSKRPQGIRVGLPRYFLFTLQFDF